MPIPKAVARFNRYVTNPVARRIAGWAPGFGILTHVGRTSGREYRIPLNVFPTGDGFVFALTYGSDTDWVKNLLAEGRGRMLHRRRTYQLIRPRFLTTEEGMSCMPAPVRVILRLVDVTEFLRMDTA